MFENLGRFFKRMVGTEPKELDVASKESKETAKERLHLVLMQDRANVSADFLELMKQEIIDVIKKYIEVDEETIDVRLTTKPNEDGSNGTPALYANIPILNIRNDMKVENFNFALESDGSIIAHKIEEPIPEETVEEKIDSLISENLEETENTFVENVNEFESETIDSDGFSKIEERQENLIKEVIPAIENIVENKENDESKNIEENLENNSEEITKSQNTNINETELGSNNELEEIKNEIKSATEIEVKTEIVEEINNDLEIQENNTELEIQQNDETQNIEEKEIKLDNTKEEASANSEELTIEAVQQLKKSCKRGRPRKKDKKNAEKKAKKASLKANKSDEEDDEDDDVTFDDLLKAAEEEDRRIAEQEKKEGK